MIVRFKIPARGWDKLLTNVYFTVQLPQFCWLASLRTPVSSVEHQDTNYNSSSSSLLRESRSVERRMLLVHGQTWNNGKRNQSSIPPLDLRKQMLLLVRFVHKSGTGNLQTEEAATAAQLLGEALVLEGDHGRSAAFYALAVDALESLFGIGSPKVVKSLTGLGFALLHQVMLAGL